MIKDLIKYITPILLILALVSISGCTEQELINEGNLSNINSTIDTYFSDMDSDNNENLSIGDNYTSTFSSEDMNITVTPNSNTSANVTVVRVIDVSKITSKSTKTSSSSTMTTMNMDSIGSYKETWTLTVEYKNGAWTVTKSKKISSVETS
jgi:hypothetical protein